MTTPTAPLTTAAEDDLAHDIASDWFATLSSTTAYSVLKVAERRNLKDIIAKGLTTYAAQVRRDTLEECAKIADHVDGLSARYIAMRIRALPPGSPSSQTDTGDK